MFPSPMRALEGLSTVNRIAKEVGTVPPEILPVFLAAFGLLVCLLVAAGLLRRYQEYKAYQRARLREQVSRVDSLERAMERLSRVPLSKGLRGAVRDRIVRHYATIQRLHREYPDIRQRIEESRLRVESDGGALNGRVPSIQGEGEYRQLLAALNTVIALLERGDAAPRNAGSRLGEWLREAHERRAEVNTRYLVVEAHRAQKKGDNRKTSALLGALLGTLRERGPDTAFVRELYSETESMYRRTVRGQPMLDGDAPEPADAA